MKSSKTIFALLLFAAFALAPLFAQAPAIKKAYLGLPMSDFELATLDGQAVKLSALKGKNVLLVFPRVFYATGEDCSLCGYQYAELCTAASAGRWKEVFNLEVLFVFPFSAEVTKSWLARLPAMLAAVEGWKNPKAEDLQKEGVKGWMEVTRRLYPKTLELAAGKIPMPFPLLLDEKRELSRGLDLFREEWSGGKGEQNIPAVFLLDKEGTVRFKLVSQSTVDRPAATYLEKIMQAVL